MMKKLCFAAFASLVISLSAIAGDIATERTQAATGAVITTISQINAKIQEVTDLIHTIEGKANAVNPMAVLATIPGVNDIFTIFDNIEAVITAGEGLAHTAADLENFIEGRFGTYEIYLDKLRTDGRIDVADIRTKFRNWSQTHRDTIKNTLVAHGMHADEVDNAEARLLRLQTLSRSADGRMKALQIGQEIATEELKQLHSLKEIIMEQSNLHGSYFAMKQSMQSQKEAVDTWINRDVGQPTVLGNEPAPFLR